MNRVLNYIDNLVLNYNYKKLPESISSEARAIYREHIPDVFNISGDIKNLYSFENTHISTGYSRIVIGDYGAFIEIPKDLIIKNNLCVKKGEEYRYKSPRYKNSVKYYWYTTKDFSDCKVYYQQHIVSYADYKKGFFYISPYEVKIL